MKAMIFAAGKGTRLKPWTDFHPKALAPIKDKPVIEWVILHINQTLHIKEFVINIHHFGEQMIQWANNFTDTTQLSLIFSDESSKLLETGGGLLYARQYLDDSEEILIHNADILTDLNFEEILRYHKISNADITLLCSERDTSRKLVFSQDNILKGWINESQNLRIPEHLSIGNHDRILAFDGIHIVNKKIFQFLQDYVKANGSDAFSLITFYLWCRDKLNIKAYRPDHDFKWIDIGKPDSLAVASQIF